MGGGRSSVHEERGSGTIGMMEFGSEKKWYISGGSPVRAFSVQNSFYIEISLCRRLVARYTLFFI